MDPLALPFATACRMGGFGRTKGYELVSRGKLELIKIDGKSLITYASLKRLIANAKRVTGPRRASGERSAERPSHIAAALDPADPPLTDGWDFGDDDPDAVASPPPSE